MYLDTNGDGVNSETDVICPSGPTVIDIYLDTSADRTGAPATCSTGPELLSFNSYEFILHVTGGTVSWGTYANRMAGFSNRITRDDRDTTEVAYYHNGWAGSANVVPGRNRIGTITVTGVSGHPAIDIVPAHPDHGWMATGFGTPCAATAARSHWYRLDAQWFDVDGAALTAGGMNVDKLPVSFSVNGPVDPNTEGIRDPRVSVASPQIPDQPGNVYGFGIRADPVPQAAGLPTTRPGDVFDFEAVPVPSEAVIFQSEPATLPTAIGEPDGTNSQILHASAAGLTAGPGVASMFWTSLPPGTLARDNIDALSFGEDYFPAGMTLGLDPASDFPSPPTPSGPWDWGSRLFGPYKERVVLDHFDPISFRFSVDPWAIGLPCTAVDVEAGPADVGAGLGPWTSPGGAAGDVFGTLNLRRIGGVTVGPTGNALVHDQVALGLAPDPPPLSPMEDDLDALECVGPNTDWKTGVPLLSGSIHKRVAHGSGAPDLGSPETSAHVPKNSAPIFFSVTRNSVGEFGSAVRSQFVNDGGAAGDVFVTAVHPVSGIATNLLFIDEAQIGLHAADASPGTTGPGDHSDDLDALLLHVCPGYRDSIAMFIDTLLVKQGGPIPWVTDTGTGARTGGGMTVSIISMLDSLPNDCVQVGFSVTSDAVGRDYTAVDWEAQPFSPPGAGSSAAGDIFYARPVGGGFTNYLWFRETDLGLDPGAWINGTSTDLADLADNLDALDSTDSTGTVTSIELGDLPATRKATLRFAGVFPNPLRFSSTIRFVMPREGRVRLGVYDVKGRFVASVIDERRSAGIQSARWDGRTSGGARAASGVYFLRLEFEDQVRSAKVVLVE